MADFTNVTFSDKNCSVTAVPLRAAYPVVQWKLTLYTVTFVVSMLGNSFMFLLITTDRQLRTPFNTYVVCLAVSNIINNIAKPFEIVNAWKGVAWAWSETACSLYMYIGWVQLSTLYNLHQVIACVRMWAVIHPQSYRTRNKQTLAVGLCVGVWVYAHLARLPFWILDTAYYRASIIQNGGSCSANTAKQQLYVAISQGILFFIPLIVLIMVTPVVFCARIAQSKKIAARLPVVPVVSGPTSGRGPKQPQRGLFLLGLLSLLAILCWLPNSCFFLMLMIDPGFATTVVPPSVSKVIVAMNIVPSSIDPIIFILSVENLRQAVCRLPTRLRRVRL
ncbi:hypothetical protein BV898_03434 [Hypsibius exemplaris]|uniref:G-protein coupled receptors family 1 profile domain-containing protein n=1 Tax=Hypsibius exemplaris TaxID=2072580 RepID=A0A1W0X519_HYPEX|nr:hypothetical protein BV898_03434 [Hypsibius exemplaris]